MTPSEPMIVEPQSCTIKARKSRMSRSIRSKDLSTLSNLSFNLSSVHIFRLMPPR